MKRIFLLLVFLPMICFADPTATPTETPTPTVTPTPIIRGNPLSTAATIGTASTYVIHPDVLRLAQELILTNDSDEAIYLNVIGGPAVMNAGIRLNANGGSISWTKRNDDWFPLEKIYAICTSGSKKLLISVR